MTDQLERDVRNAVIIDQLRKLDWKGNLMVFLLRNTWRVFILASIILWCLIVFGMHAAFATDQCPRAPVECPTSEPCHYLVLSPVEEKALTQPNGVLDTAAQGRALELGQFVVYLKQRIATSPMGENKPVDKP